MRGDGEALPMTENRAWTWRHAIIKSGLQATTRHVLLTISCFMNELGDGCYPTQEQIAEATGLSDRSVRTHLEIAEREGWIKRSEHGFRGQKWRNHQYVASWPEAQNVEKGAEAGSGPYQEGAEPSSGNVRNVVPKGAEAGSDYQSIHQSKNQSTLGAQARGGGFSKFWEEWPDLHRPDNRDGAEAIFCKLSAADQNSAVESAREYRRLQALRSKPARMFTYLKDRLFLDFVDAPETDADGDFVIKPGRPEWPLWLGHVRSKHGERGVQSILKVGKIIVKTRWPDGQRHAA